MVPVLAWVCGALTVRDAYSARYHTPVNSCGALLALRTLSPTPIRRRTAPTSGPRVDGQHVFDSRYERAIGLRRDDPLLDTLQRRDCGACSCHYQDSCTAATS